MATASREGVEVLRIKAAEPTMKKLRDDLKKASAQVGPIIRYLQEHLFDPDLTAGRLLTKSGIRDKTISSQMSNDLGLSPWKYVIDCRMEVAARMLLNSNLYPWRVAVSVGYSGINSFGKAFQRWSGQRPMDFRRNPNRPVESEEISGPELFQPGEVREALAGRLDARAAEILALRLRAAVDRIEEIYTIHGHHRKTSPFAVLGSELVEGAIAQQVWELIKNGPVRPRPLPCRR